MNANKDKNVDHGLIVWARVDAVIKLILDNPAYLHKKRSGDLTRNVVQQIKKQTKENITERTARRYIEEAKKEIKALGKLKFEKKFERAIFNRISLIQRARIEGDLKTELNTLKDLAELEDLYPEKKVNLKGELLLKHFDPSKLTDKQLERLKAGEDPVIVLAQEPLNEPKQKIKSE
jgi:hypothetical protein